MPLSAQLKLTTARCLMLVLSVRLTQKPLHLTFKWWILSRYTNCSASCVNLSNTHHFGTRRHVKVQAADDSEMRVNFEVTTESTRPILLVMEGADSGSMTSFKPHGGGRTTQDKEAIWNITKILNSTQEFDIVYEIGAYVLDTKNRESSQTQYVQPVIRNDRRGRALSHAAKEHERKRKLESEGFEKTWTNLTERHRTNLRKPHVPTARERMEHELTNCTYWARCEICVGGEKS